MVGKEDRDSAGSAGGDGETGHSPVERGAGALSVNAGLGDFPQAFFMVGTIEEALEKAEKLKAAA